MSLDQLNNESEPQVDWSTLFVKNIVTIGEGAVKEK